MHEMLIVTAIFTQLLYTRVHVTINENLPAVEDTQQVGLPLDSRVL